MWHRTNSNGARYGGVRRMKGKKGEIRTDDSENGCAASCAGDCDIFDSKMARRRIDQVKCQGY
jgi:hypothetical protein